MIGTQPRHLPPHRGPHRLRAGFASRPCRELSALLRQTLRRHRQLMMASCWRDRAIAISPPRHPHHRQAHERSLNIDFLLGFVKQLLPKRPDLSSCLGHHRRGERHFGNARDRGVGTALSGGDALPPCAAKDEDEQERDMEQAIVDAVDGLPVRANRRRAGVPARRQKSGYRGGCASTPSEARAGTRSIEILPLYARLSFAEQGRCSGHRTAAWCSTNVARPLTVPNIRFVVDFGLAQVNVTATATGGAAAGGENLGPRQPAGGALWTGHERRLLPAVFEEASAAAEFTDPEILRSSLASAILRMQ